MDRQRSQWTARVARMGGGLMECWRSQMECRRSQMERRRSQMEHSRSQMERRRSQIKRKRTQMERQGFKWSANADFYKQRS